ncbi:MAG TPA: hypothetical protein VKR06_46880 [Ktedonosporobacter sp.]|nr:hypothetical protein [Ktedonosporobacter sp.]
MPKQTHKILACLLMIGSLSISFFAAAPPTYARALITCDIQVTTTGSQYCLYVPLSPTQITAVTTICNNLPSNGSTVLFQDKTSLVITAITPGKCVQFSNQNGTITTN